MAIMSTLRADDWVEVRSKEEILRTLDKNGRLQELPFMPQMFQYCGKRFKVYKSSHKTCDTVSGKYVGRKLANGIHLDLRCNGQAYGGCQAACLIFWKEDWLKPADGNTAAPELRSHVMPAGGGAPAVASRCTEDDVLRGTRVQDQQAGAETRYICQATHLLKFTTPLQWYDIRQYVEDYRSGNASLRRILSGLIYVGYYYGTLAYKNRLGRPSRWLYDRVQSLRGGVPFPWRSGLIPVGQPTPASNLNLQAGDLVRVKSYEQIRATIDQHRINRNMAWDAELVPYCGGTYRVKTRVENFIDEKTGRSIKLKTPAVILEDVTCQSRYSSCRMFCPRSIHPWWREVWLERVPE
jgi:hypothetical protein